MEPVQESDTPTPLAPLPPTEAEAAAQVRRRTPLTLRVLRGGWAKV